jgi:hypothetical protein
MYCEENLVMSSLLGVDSKKSREGNACVNRSQAEMEKRAFKNYLSDSGVVHSLSSVLSQLYIAQRSNPNIDPISFIKNNIGSSNHNKEFSTMEEKMNN